MATVTRRYAEDRLSWAHTDIFKAGLDPFTFLVYAYLAARADSNGKAWPKQETIAAECQVSERQVRNCIEKLVEARLIVVLEQSGPAGGRRKFYFLATRNEWLSKQLQEGEQPAGDAGLQVANRQELPVQPAGAAGSLYKGTNPEELNPNKGGDSAPVVPSKAPSKGGSKKKKAVDPKTFLAEFPAEFRHDDSFVQAWDNWGQNRIENNDALTARGAAIARNKLIRHTIPIAIEALERATMGNWSGVFPDSLVHGGKSGKFDSASSEQPKQDFGF